MAEPFKNMFSPATVDQIATALDLPDAFVSDATRDLHTLELKDRVRHIAAALRTHLPDPFPEAVERMIAGLPTAADDDTELTDAWWVWPLNHYVGEHGLGHPEVAVDALQELTQRFSSEFAIRPYLDQHQAFTLARLTAWLDHDSVHVRRLVSEGSRPRLPWGMHLKEFQRDPAHTLPLLERLKDDPELYVRRSVANHLNDISKDHPDRAADIGATWLVDASKERSWVVRHALRGLIKKGHPGALAALGFHPPEVTGAVTLGSNRASVGGSLLVNATIGSTSNKPQKLVIDYAVHHQKANGTLSPKVFKWTKKTLAAGETLTLSKKHSLKKVTTRRYYPGLHRVELQVNGKSFGLAEFTLDD